MSRPLDLPASFHSHREKIKARDWFAAQSFHNVAEISVYDQALALIEAEMAKVREREAAEAADRREALKDAFRRSVEA
jgi:hypothetical protein